MAYPTVALKNYPNYARKFEVLGHRIQLRKQYKERERFLKSEMKRLKKFEQDYMI